MGRPIQSAGRVGPCGVVRLGVIPGRGRSHTAVPGRELTLREMVYYGFPRRGLPDEVRRWRTANLPHVWRGIRRVLAARALKLPHFYGQLSFVKFPFDAAALDFGLASLQVVTTAGVGFLVDAFQNLVELENMKFHALGTGTNAEAVGDAALQTELTTQYNPDNTRATGSTTESAANVYRTVGTNAVDASAAVTEHGVLSQAATGGGVLLDRSQFAAINLVSGDSLQSTYDFTVNSGG